ncbi:MAG: hypothetical protein WBW04_22350 [Nitrolancea sp.]
MANTITPFRPTNNSIQVRTFTQTRAIHIEPTSTHRNLTLAYILSSALTLVATVAGAIGTFNSGIFRDPPMTAGNAQGTSLVVLAVAVPALIVSMILVARGSARAEVFWLGSLGYLLYNSVLFTFDTTFNRLFLVYVAMFGLALWSVVSLLTTADPESIKGNFSRRTPVRLIGGYLLATAILFGYAWMADIIPALIHNTRPGSLDKSVMLSNPVEILDLSISLPLLVLAGVWIWKRRTWGYLLAGIMLVTYTIEALGVAVDQVFGHRADPTQSLGAVPLMIALTVIGLVMTGIYMWHMRESRD